MNYIKYAFIMLCSILVLSGCETIRWATEYPSKKYSFNVAENEPLCAGKLIYKSGLFSKNATVNDIAINGAPGSGLFETVNLTGSIYKTLHWDGYFNYDDVKQPFSLSYCIIYNDTSTSSLYPEHIYKIDFSKLPNITTFSCIDFDQLKIVYPKDMPYTIATFMLNGIRYNINCTIINDQKVGNYQAGLDLVYFVNNELQRLEIVDQSNNVYADSDIYSYRIYTTTKDLSISDLKNIVGMSWLIQRICFDKP